MKSIAVQKVFTDHDGNYVFESVPPGNYVVYSQQFAMYCYVDWAIPVTVKSDATVTLDLNNEKATAISNPGDPE